MSDNTIRPVDVTAVDTGSILKAADHLLRRVALYRRRTASGYMGLTVNYLRGDSWLSALHLDKVLWDAGLRGGWLRGDHDKRRGLVAIHEGVHGLLAGINDSPYAVRSYVGGTKGKPVQQIMLAVPEGQPFVFDEDAVANIDIGAELLRGATPPPVRDRKAGQPSCRRVSTNEARDRFCYNQRKAGKALKEIQTKVNEKEGWEPLGTPQAVSGAAKRYAIRHGKKWPI